MTIVSKADEQPGHQSVVERQFLALVVQKWHARYGRILRLIEPGYLSLGAYQWFAPVLTGYLREHATVPPWEYCDVQLARDFEADPEKLKAMREAIYLVYSIPVTWGDQAVEDFRDYLAWRVYSAGFDASQQGYRRTKSMRITIDSAARSVWKAATILQDAEAHDLLNDFSVAQADWTRARDFPGLKKKFTIGIPELDEDLRLEEGTVTAVLGSFKSGKSIVLNHFALAALLHGYNVAQIVYENSYELTRDRHFARLFELPYNDIIKGAAELKEPAEWQVGMAFVSELEKRLDVRLKIIQADPKRTTVDDIEAQLDVLRDEEGFEPEVTIWDYANLIGVPKDRREKEERINQETVIWDLQRHAKDTKRGGMRKKIVVTAVQAKAEAAKKEHLDIGDFGKSIGIPQALDSGLGVSQQFQDKLDGRIRFTLLISRSSKAGEEVQLACDLSKMCIASCTNGWFKGKAEELWMRRAR